MSTEKDILIVEPFNGGSHGQLIKLLQSEYEIGQRSLLVALPAKKWHWRARTSALYFSQTIPYSSRFRVLFSSSVLNLAELIALRPDLAQLKKIVYFHENQLVYPIRKMKERDFQYGYNQILTSLVADIVVFNSTFNMESFLSSISTHLKLIPDHRPKDLEAVIRPKCKVLYFPITINQYSANCIDATNSDINSIDTTSRDVHYDDATNSYVHSVDASSRDVHSMDASNRDFYSVNALSRDVNSVYTTSRDVNSVDATNRNVHSVDATSRDVHSVDARSRDANSVDATNRNVDSVDAISRDVHSVDTTNRETNSDDTTNKDVPSIDSTSRGIHPFGFTKKDILLVDTINTDIHPIDDINRDIHFVDATSRDIHLVYAENRDLHPIDTTNTDINFVDATPRDIHTVCVENRDITNIDIHLVVTTNRDFHFVDATKVHEENDKSSEQSTGSQADEMFSESLHGWDETSIISEHILESPEYSGSLNKEQSHKLQDKIETVNKETSDINYSIGNNNPECNFENDPRLESINRIMEPLKGKETCLHIVWPHRWEHDKDPESFFQALLQLQSENFDFVVSVIGETFTDVPDIFKLVKPQLADKILAWGYQTRQDYIRIMNSAHVVVSTALHEFFGVAMLEATGHGCYPLCPKRLVYPEIYPTECLYATQSQLVKRLKRFCQRPSLAKTDKFKVLVEKFSWQNLQSEYRKLLLE